MSADNSTKKLYGGKEMKKIKKSYTVSYIKCCGTRKQQKLSREFTYLAWADKFANKMYQMGYSHIMVCGDDTCYYL